jgi:hypothetical protein
MNASDHHSVACWDRPSHPIYSSIALEPPSGKAERELWKSRGPPGRVDSSTQRRFARSIPDGPTQIESQWKARRSPHTFCLKQMPALMLRDDFQARANSETQQWDERILEPDTVYVVVHCSPDQLPDALVTAKKRLQNGGFHLLGGFYLLGCPSTRSPGVWSNVAANEPTAEPAETDVVDWSALSAFQSSSNRGQIDFIRYAEVLQTLAYTPGTLPGLPIELYRIESFCDRLGASIGGA